MKKQNILKLFAALFLTSATSLTAADKMPVYRVGYNNWIGNLPLFVAVKNGSFEKAGLKVEMKAFDAPGDGLVPLMSGDLDAHFTTADAVILRSAQAPGQIKIAALVDTSSGADAIVGGPKVKTIGDLKGKSLGVTLGECGQLLLSKALASGGLKENDVKMVNMTPDAAGTALKAGQIDAAVTWEPWISQLTATGGTVVYSTKETPNLILDCIAISKTTAAKKAAETKIFLKVIDETTKQLNADPAGFSKIQVPQLEMPSEEILDMLGKLKFYDAAGSKLAMNGAAVKDLGEIAEFFKQIGSTPKAVNVSELMNSDFLP